MNFAVITDVHADVHALRDALAHIDKLGVDEIVCCGDLIDYGLFPEDTLTLLRERKIRCIRGNHDRWALADGVDMSGWDLTSRSIAFLESLPTSWTKAIDGVRVAVHHARPGNDMNGIPHDATDAELVELLREAATDVLIVGHTHVPFARWLPGGRLVANPGALLRDPAPGVDIATPGTFGLLAIENGAARFEIRRAATGEIVQCNQNRRRGR